LWPWGRLSLLQKWRRSVRRADNLTTFMCRLSRNSWASTSWNPKGLCRPVVGKLYLLLVNNIWFHRQAACELNGKLRLGHELATMQNMGKRGCGTATWPWRDYFRACYSSDYQLSKTVTLYCTQFYTISEITYFYLYFSSYSGAGLQYQVTYKTASSSLTRKRQRWSNFLNTAISTDFILSDNHRSSHSAAAPPRAVLDKWGALIRQTSQQGTGDDSCQIKQCKNYFVLSVWNF
jgi:hypothetical protein